MLNLSKNKIGAKGAKYLSDALRQMKILAHLDIAENEIGDIGIADIARAAKDFGMLEYLDISGNNIGKTSYSTECAECLNTFLT